MTLAPGEQKRVDVLLSVEGKQPVHFHGRQGGNLVSPEAVTENVKAVLAGKLESRSVFGRTPGKAIHV